MICGTFSFLCSTESMIWHSLGERQRSEMRISHSFIELPIREMNWIDTDPWRGREIYGSREKWWLRISRKNESGKNICCSWILVREECQLKHNLVALYLPWDGSWNFLPLSVTDSSQVQSFERLVFYFFFSSFLYHGRVLSEEVSRKTNQALHDHSNSFTLNKPFKEGKNLHSVAIEEEHQLIEIKFVSLITDHGLLTVLHQEYQEPCPVRATDHHSSATSYLFFLPSSPMSSCLGPRIPTH